MQKYKPYKKGSEISYALGVFPTLTLLESQPQSAQAVLLSRKLKPSTGHTKISELCAAHAIPIEEVDHSVLTRIAHSENCFAAAVFNVTNTPLSAKDSHIVLFQPDDMGNLGTILRTCLGFAIRDVAIITPAADVFDPKTVRASMGALFQLRVAQFASIIDYAKQFPAHHVYPFVLHGAQKLSDVTFHEPCSLVFGNEGAGLPSAFTTLPQSITIEQTDLIDSLNVAQSVGIALYHRFVSRQR